MLSVYDQASALDIGNGMAGTVVRTVAQNITVEAS